MFSDPNPSWTWVSGRAVPAACEGTGRLPSAAGVENTLKSVPCGGGLVEKAWRQRWLLALSGLALPGKSNPRHACVCLRDHTAVAHLAGPQAGTAAPRVFAEGGEGTFVNAVPGGVPPPAEQELRWPRGSAEIIWLSPKQLVKEMHTGSDKCSGGACAVSQPVLVW